MGKLCGSVREPPYHNNSKQTRYGRVPVRCLEVCRPKATPPGLPLIRGRENSFPPDKGGLRGVG